jgi:GNAT superfamily N-acetyltransferase
VRFIDAVGYGDAMTEIRPARPHEAALIHQLLFELAEYEKLTDQFRLEVADIERALFGEPARAFCDLAFDADEPIGFALWYYTFPTFAGRLGIWLEDLYVRPQARGRGAGKALLARLARRCAEEDLSRVEWSVLDWNAPSIAFYDSLGAGTKTGWITRRLTGEALARLAME